MLTPAFVPLSVTASPLVLFLWLHTVFPCGLPTGFFEGTAGNVPHCFMGALVFFEHDCDSVLGPSMAQDFNVGPCCCCAITMLASPIKVCL